MLPEPCEVVPRIVDCHVHLYPPAVIADPRAWGTARGETWWTHCMDPPGQRTLQGWADVNQLLRDMDRAGIEKAVLLGWYWEHQETCELQNRWYSGWTRAHPDRLLAFAAVQPNSGDRGLEDVRRALDAGFCGLGELLPQAQGWSFEDANWARLVALAVERDMPINLHVSSAVAGNTTSKTTPLDDFVRLVKRFPGATFILAHWGGGLPFFFECKAGLRQAFQNVYFDTSASSLLFDKNVFRRVVDLVGAERVLFGTDYPLLCYPRETRTPDLVRPLADAADAGLTGDELDLVLGGNLRRLLKRA